MCLLLVKGFVFYFHGSLGYQSLAYLCELCMINSLGVHVVWVAAMIYEKPIHLTSAHMAHFNQGELVNMVAADCQVDLKQSLCISLDD